MFDLSKIFDLSKKVALPDTLLKSKNYCSNPSYRTGVVTSKSELSCGFDLEEYHI
jgi:hypothetical protein